MYGDAHTLAWNEIMYIYLACIYVCIYDIYTYMLEYAYIYFYVYICTSTQLNALISIYTRI